ncbi:MAG: pantoate--beta-alanine ligase [Bacteroidetes bacterium]|nr:pantoate--beta-alanine ligase [Bacteroidota bacterium]
MISFTTVNDLSAYIREIKPTKTIGFVPTMGALHQGHISLIKQSKKLCEITICSIFVNPTQFNNPSDLENYPRLLENDMKLLLENGCDVLFHPNVAQIYPDGLLKNEEDYGQVVRVFEGLHRPGHFDGVITVVASLFDIVKPNKSFFGQKDYQQCMVVAELIKRKFPQIELNICPILREESGLALSSRNLRLNETEKISALLIYKALNHIKVNYSPKDLRKLIEEAKQIIATSSLLSIEYLDIVNANNLEPIGNSITKVVALAAVHCGDVRLIDNILLN